MLVTPASAYQRPANAQGFTATGTPQGSRVPLLASRMIKMNRLKEVRDVFFYFTSLMMLFYLFVFARFIFITNDGEMGSSIFLLIMLVLGKYMFLLWLWARYIKRLNIESSGVKLQMSLFFSFGILPLLTLAIFVLTDIF
jgi:hypothetical protein